MRPVRVAGASATVPAPCTVSLQSRRYGRSGQSSVAQRGVSVCQPAAGAPGVFAAAAHRL